MPHPDLSWEAFSPRRRWEILAVVTALDCSALVLRSALSLSHDKIRQSDLNNAL